MYLSFNKKTITDFSDENINTLYNKGYVFVRTGYGDMDQTRSVRINLDKFEMSSENKRILRKTEDMKLDVFIDLPYSDYHWSIGKLAKDFYETKFDIKFSAHKIKELLTDKSNFNKFLTYGPGYSICKETNKMVHYSYPFYDLEADKNTGMGMMVRAVEYAKEQGKKYIYLGSAQRPGDTYKFQFSGMEWFDGEGWSEDFEKLKIKLKA